VSTEIVMPRLSDTMDRGTVAHWNKKPGDRVKRGEVLLEIETDKANMELESYSDGIVARIMVAEGETATVGAPIGIVADTEAELKQIESSSDRNSSASAPAVSNPGVTQPAISPSASIDVAKPSVSSTGRTKASPLARRIAMQRGIDLSTIVGTGPGGRIIREDVETASTAGASSLLLPLPAETQEAASAPQPHVLAQGDEMVPLTRMQQTVARRLSESTNAAPHFYVTTEIDMTDAVALRTTINTAEPELKVSFNDLVMKAVGVTLRKFPQINASYSEGSVIRRGPVNVGIAVDLPSGLIVPVLKDVDRKSIREIATETKSLVAAAREAKLLPNNFEGGTFTVSNLGMFGVDEFTAIINPPESAILAVGAVQRKAVVLDGEIVARWRLRVTLSCDHRVIYGADAAAFLAEFRRTLEQPVLVLL
jgi:pyruvate dehydrogenase E2 component (dihydrolipoamide acetyltransferase)